MAGQHIHMCIDLRGILGRIARAHSKKAKRDAVAGFTYRGREAFWTEVQDWAHDHLEQGHRVAPMSDTPCEGFDWVHGCPGHRTDAPPEAG